MGEPAALVCFLTSILLLTSLLYDLILLLVVIIKNLWVKDCVEVLVIK